MNAVVKKVIEKRLTKLKSDSEYQRRQVQFLFQRLAEFRENLVSAVEEMIALEAFLTSEATPEFQPKTSGCFFHSSPDVEDTTHVPKHTNVIVG